MYSAQNAVKGLFIIRIFYFFAIAPNVKHFIHRFQAKVAKKWDVQLFVGRFLFGR